MGRVLVKLMVANNQHVQMAKVGALDPSKVIWFELEAVADSGATHLVLPTDVAERLALPKGDDVIVRYADRRSTKKPTVEEVRVELLGRQGTFRAHLEPDRSTALIGAIILEDLDFLVDCKNQKLVPRDPNVMIEDVDTVEEAS
jgi:predicted aspartyl protease